MARGKGRRTINGKQAAKQGLIQAELGERIDWLIRLRWLAVAGVLLTLWLSSNLLSILPRPLPLYIIAASIACYNTAFLLYAKKMHPRRESPTWFKAANIFANIQISLDLVALTLLIHFSGGAENPFVFYFIFHMIIASILLSPGATYLQATLATFLFTATVIL